MKFIGYKLTRTGKDVHREKIQGIQHENFRTNTDVDFVTSPIFDEESFFSDEGFDDFLGEIQEVGNRPWEIASFEKKLRVIFLMIMIIIGSGFKSIIYQDQSATRALKCRTFMSSRVAPQLSTPHIFSIPVKGLPLNFIILAISLHDRKNKPSSSWLLFNICIGKNLAVGKVLIFILLHQYENQYKTNFSRSFHMCKCCITNSTRVRPFQRLDRLGYYK